ncbi:MAG: hypothetical protein OIN83_02845 [Candidatus Methanoperedens sp.]|nr:hypothetical protein [Candidatus Methanoperedens sp.]
MLSQHTIGFDTTFGDILCDNSGDLVEVNFDAGFIDYFDANFDDTLNATFDDAFDAIFDANYGDISGDTSGYF